VQTFWFVLQNVVRLGKTLLTLENRGMELTILKELDCKALFKVKYLLPSQMFAGFP